MVLQGYKATSAKLANGELVFVNGQSSSIQRPRPIQIRKLTAPDHVYVSPPWSDRDGELHPTLCLWSVDTLNSSFLLRNSILGS